MMKLYDYIYELNCIIPLELAEEWDNCGFQIDLGDRKIQKVLVALEITDSVADEAVAGGFDLIVTHHPLMFEGIKRLDINDAPGRYIKKLMDADIPVYSCHTNFDICDGGNNDYLANLLDLDEICPMDDEEITRMGNIQSSSVKQIASDLAEKLDMDISEFRIVGDIYEDIESVGLCSGAGAQFIELAAFLGCELFITGDLKHHEARRAQELGINVIDAGHYGTERIFSDAFIRLMEISEFTNDIEFIRSEACYSPFLIIK